jgi:hypothetical protein
VGYFGCFGSSTVQQRVLDSLGVGNKQIRELIWVRGSYRVVSNSGFFATVGVHKGSAGYAEKKKHH